MILDEYVEVTVGPSFKYYKEKGYEFESAYSKIKVKVSDLLPKSNVQLGCKCNECGTEYLQRRSRNTEVCYPCRKRKQMLGNTLGSLGLRYPTPPKEELLSVLDKMQNYRNVAKHYGITNPVLKRWMQELGIDWVPYLGRKIIKNSKEFDNLIYDIKTKYSHLTPNEIARKTGHTRHYICQLKEKGFFSVQTFFDKEKEKQDFVLSNISIYVKENDKDKKNLTDIAKDHGISLWHLRKAFYLTGNTIKLHSYNKSKGELEVKDFIKSLGVDCFSSMFDKTYEIDCYVPEKNFGLEYCGEYWHRYVPALDNKYYHRNKMEFARTKGISLMTIFELEWKSKPEIIKSMIKSKIGLLDKIPAKKCSIVSLEKSIANDFHDQNHLSSFSTNSINLGLEYQGELVSVLSLSKSRFDKNYEYEISRFSSKLDHTVVGGLGKLFNYFVSEYDPSSCMTYVDLRVGLGKSYEKIGFSFLGKTSPNYFYCNNKGDKMEGRMKFQKHMLKSWPQYSPEKTELQIMEDSGYFRVYDCGNMKYGWIR